MLRNLNRLVVISRNRVRSLGCLPGRSFTEGAVIQRNNLLCIIVYSVYDQNCEATDKAI